MLLDERFDWRGRHISWGSRGSGPPVVFCHGTPWSSALWAPFADAVSSAYTVYLWDMPGYGTSSKDPAHAVDLGTQGEAFTALLDHWSLERPHVVAHDVGGAVALRAHLLHRVPLASLCLVDVVALRPWGSPFFSLVQQHAEVFAQLPPAVHRGALEAYIAGASHRGLRSEDLAALADPWCDEIGQAAFYRQVAQADERFTREFESSLHRVGAPAHIVWGQDDAWIPVTQAHRLHETIPGSTLATVADAGHLVHLDQPAALAAQLTTWLASVPPAGSS